MKKVLLFGMMVLALGIILTILQTNLGIPNEVEKDCQFIKSPQINYDSIDNSLNKLESSDDFKGYKLNDYVECN